MGASGVLQSAPGLGKYSYRAAQGTARSITLRAAIESTPTQAVPLAVAERPAFVQDLHQVQLNRASGNSFRDLIAKNFPGAEKEVRIAAFQHDGRISTGYMYADIIARDATSAPGLIVETKLNPFSPLTGRQEQHLPLLQDNGGLILGTGEYIPAGRVNTVYGPD